MNWEDRFNNKIDEGKIVVFANGRELIFGKVDRIMEEQFFVQEYISGNEPRYFLLNDSTEIVIVNEEIIENLILEKLAS